MNIGLCAANDVGHRIAKVMWDAGCPPACLVLDANDSELNKRNITKVSNVPRNRIYRSDDPYLANELRSCDLDLLILAWWPYIIKKELIGIPKIGCLNTHYSYLPYHRGKNGNFWSLVDGAPFGATIHFVDEGVDSGDIAFQKVIEKTWEDTGGTLYKKVQDEIVRLFKENFEQIRSGNIPRRDQNLCYELNPGSYHHSRELEPASRIDLHRSYQAKDLLNLIRARTFPPYQAAWFIDGGTKYEVRIQITKAGEGS